MFVGHGWSDVWNAVRCSHHCCCSGPTIVAASLTLCHFKFDIVIVSRIFVGMRLHWFASGLIIDVDHRMAVSTGSHWFLCLISGDDLALCPIRALLVRQLA